MLSVPLIALAQEKEKKGDDKSREENKEKAKEKKDEAKDKAEDAVDDRDKVVDAPGPIAARTVGRIDGAMQ